MTLDAIGISLRALVHVMNLFLIVFVIFILAGVSLYQTSFQRRCVLPQGERQFCVICISNMYMCGFHLHVRAVCPTSSMFTSLSHGFIGSMPHGN